MTTTGEDDEHKGPHLPEGLLARLKSDPVHALQHLALAAVDQWGEDARDYARKERAEHPQATNRELADVVKNRHALLARMEGATAGVPPTFAPIIGAAVTILPDLTALAWIQSRMVIYIAAVYGHDTTKRDTAAELLVLQGIYNTTDAARLALVEGGKRVATRVVKKYITGATLQLLKQLGRYVGIKFTRVGLLRAVPLISIPISAAVNEASTRSLGNRAMTFYDLDPRGKK
ncbi:MAG: hypothetical protein QOI73_3495 [Solirubrobacteraceae bacterium]|nr:hypothetical protein [Solirubrobacteraceae bacterium]